MTPIALSIACCILLIPLCTAQANFQCPEIYKIDQSTRNLIEFAAVITKNYNGILPNALVMSSANNIQYLTEKLQEFEKTANLENFLKALQSETLYNVIFSTYKLVQEDRTVTQNNIVLFEMLSLFREYKLLLDTIHKCLAGTASKDFLSPEHHVADEMLASFQKWMLKLPM